MNRLKEHSIYLEEMGKAISHCHLLGTGQGTIGERVDIEGQPQILLRTIGGLGEEGGMASAGVILNLT